MGTRYVIERIAKQPSLRRIKDSLRNRYIKHPHGADTWTVGDAEKKAKALNEALASSTTDLCNHDG